MPTQISPPRVATPLGHPGVLERWFWLRTRGSSVKSEVRGGVVNFFTMLYIIPLNALIMATQKDVTGHYLGGGTAPNLAGVAVATAVVAAVSSIVMGSVANFPLALATGLGLNAFVTFAVAPTMTWPEAMGLIVIEGVVMFLLSLTGFRGAVFRAVPEELRTAIAVGIGFFIAFIGLFDGGVVRKAPATPVQLGTDGTLHGWPTLVFVVGLLVIVVLWVRKVRSGILYGIIGATVLAMIIEAVAHVGSQTDSTGKVVNPTGWGLNVPKWPHSVVGTPDFSTMFHVSFGAFHRVGVLTSVLIIFTMLLSNFFDTMGTATAIGREADHLDGELKRRNLQGRLLDADGNPRSTLRIFLADSFAGFFGGWGGTSSATAYIESASGVAAGARTGLAPIVTGGLFGLAIFLAPLVTVVPYEAVTPALVFVGYLMFRQILSLKLRDLETAFPVFVTIIMMPFTYSISIGIGAGFIAYVVVKWAAGKAREVHWLMYVVSAVFVISFALGPIKSWLGVG